MITQTTRAPRRAARATTAASPAADDGSQKTPFELGEVAPGGEDLLVGERDDRAARARDRLLGLGRWAGSAMRIAVAIVKARSEASPARRGQASPSSSKPSA